MLAWCYMRHSLDVQHDHVLKKLNFDLLIPAPRVRIRGGVGGGLQVEYLLPCYCICDSPLFFECCC